MKHWHLRIWALRKSMFAQMVVLTAIFLGWGLYSLAVQPLMQSETDGSAKRPAFQMTLTHQRLQKALGEMVSARRAGWSAIERSENLTVMRAVIAANPGFRYYGRSGSETFGNAPPKFFSSLKVEGAIDGIRAASAAGICANVAKAPAYDPSSYYSFDMCDIPRYYEYTGLNNPIVIKETSPTRAMAIRYWYFYNEFFEAAAGLFAIVVLVLTAHTLMIRRVAALTRSFDPEDLKSRLPEKGLATEFVPLVRAVNHLMGKVDEGQQRNSFFLSAAAHEMRTPLTVLRTRLELMEEGPTRDRLIEDLRDLIDLVNQLLSLMSIGNRRDIAGLVDVVACCRQVIEEAGESAARHEVQLEFRMARERWEVAGDGVLIRSAIGNLVANAISFSPRGSSVEVSVGPAGRVSVRDHGPGITHVDPAAVFEPFVRGPVSRRGFGLGLAIVKAVTKLHGGTADTRNADDGGAIFSATFSGDDER